MRNWHQIFSIVGVLGLAPFLAGADSCKSPPEPAQTYKHNPNQTCIPPDNGVTRPFGSLVEEMDEATQLAAKLADIDEKDFDEWCVDSRYDDEGGCLDDSGPWRHAGYYGDCYSFYPRSGDFVPMNVVIAGWSGIGDDDKCRREMKENCRNELVRECQKYDWTYDGIWNIAWQTIYNYQTGWTADFPPEKTFKCSNTCEGYCYRR